MALMQEAWLFYKANWKVKEGLEELKMHFMSHWWAVLRVL